jgi:O-antigen/teichoic acid export membrane protein
MVIPQVIMERHLEFDKLALIEVSQAISFNAVAVFLAWRGFGVLAFAAALVARSAVGAVFANLICPWKAGFLWDSAVLKTHVAFGVMLQGGQFFSMVKDSITPLFIGLFLGAKQMGYATWAITFASYSTILLMPMQRLYLPFFAKLQHDRSALQSFVPRALWIVNLIAAPLTVFTVVFAKPITTLIFGDKWLVALPLFYCFSAVNISAPSNTPLLGLLNALGKPHLTLWMIALATVSIWALGVPLVIHFGLIGFGLAAVIASSINLLLYWMVWRETMILPWRSFWPAWPVSIALGAVLYLVQLSAPVGAMLDLMGYFLTDLCAYCAIIWFGFRRESRAWIRLLSNRG